MNVFVVYGSRLGATRGIAERIADRLRASGLQVGLAAAETVGELPAADAYVIGSGLYAQHWMKAAAELVRRNRSVLATHPVWLFSSGPVGEWALAHQAVEPGQVAGLRRSIRARDHQVFAGALDHAALDGSDLSLVERFVSRRFMGEGDYRDWDRIDAWANSIARAL